MKKNDLILISSVLLYSYLFFEQTAGINFLIFTIALILLLIIKDRLVIFNKSWIYACAGSLISAICIFFHDSYLAIIANIISLSLLASFSINKGSSLILAAIYSLYSYLSAIPFMFLDWSLRLKKKVSETNKSYIRLLIILIPFIITLIFFFMYREANPLFKDFTRNINFDFLSWKWTWFTFGGFVLLYGFFYHRKINYFYNKDINSYNALSEVENNNNNFLLKIMDVSNENLSGVVLLVLLNILVLLVNILDINYLWISKNLPEGVTFSEFVHQGIGMLITSIICAILIILYYFRGSQNFFNKNQTLKIFAYLWIIQNVVLILSTAVRNQLYVNEYSLTYKRIGVYVYLLLCLIGLATTFVKILRKRSNWYLFRENGWAFYCVLIISCFINWDLLITEFNIKHSKELDKFYLLYLSESNIPNLIDDANENPEYFTHKEVYEQILSERTYKFLNNYFEKGWQSSSYSDYQIHKSLINLSDKGRLNSFKINSYHGDTMSLKPLYELKNLKTFSVTSPLRNTEELKYFPHLQNLSFHYNYDTLKGFPILKELVSIQISGGKLTNLKNISQFPNLRNVDFSENKLNHISEISQLKKLQKLNLNNNEIVDCSALTGSNLEELIMSRNPGKAINSLPHLSHLESLDISFMDLNDHYPTGFNTIKTLEELKKLNISNNSISDISMLPAQVEEINGERNLFNSLTGIEYFQHLKILNLKSNKISNIEAIRTLVQIKNLNLSANNITSIEPLSKLTSITSLDLSANQIASLTPLLELTKLETLNIYNNKIIDLSPLKAMKNLKILNLGNNHFTDLTPLTELNKLEYLNLGSTFGKDLTPLFKLKNLKELQAYDIPEATRISLEKALPGIKIFVSNESISPVTDESR